MDLPQRKIYTVSELTENIKSLVEKHYSSVWIHGEISNFKVAPSGHLYFSLKDENAQIRCAMFRIQSQFLKFKPHDGLSIIAWGRISVYPPRGDYQLLVDTMEPAGLGSMMLGLEQLKRKLEAEGLFAPSRKRPIPRFPSRVGLVTSPRGAAVRDMIRIIQRRSPGTHILISPTSVQGDRAPSEIVAALNRLCQVPDVDTIIIGRGGGSIEDLWAFNDEGVVRAVAECPIPIVSAVGHETDVTLTDFAADLRASTPSAAAELVVPDYRDLLELTNLLRDRLIRSMERDLDQRALALNELLQHLQDPRRMIRDRWQYVDELSERLITTVNRRLSTMRKELDVLRNRLRPEHLKRSLETKEHILEGLVTRLKQSAGGFLKERFVNVQSLASRMDVMSPLAVLARGYAIAIDPLTSHVIRQARQVEKGADVLLRLYQGKLVCRVLDRDLSDDLPVLRPWRSH